MTILVLLLTAALPVQPAGKCVLDEAHALAPAEFTQLEAACEKVDKSGDGQIEIVLTDDFRGGDKEEFSNTLFHAWQIGHKGKDDGVLVVLSPSMRKWRIEIGYGLEGRLADVDTSRIGNDLGVPAWKAGHWGAGLISVVGALAGQIHAEAATAPPSLSAGPSGFGVLSVVLVLLFIATLVGLFIHIRRLSRREQEEEAERQAYLARQAMADYRNNPAPYSQRVQTRARRSTPTPSSAPVAPSTPSVAAAAVVIAEAPRYSDDSSSSYSSSSSYDPPSFDSGGFSGGGGGDSGGGGAGGDF